MNAARGVLGLRGRLVAALMLMAIVTLVVAAAAVLSPLERRLSDQEMSTLTDTALTARESFSDLDAGDVRRHAPALDLLTRQLGRRTDAQVAVVDSAGRVLAGTDLDPDQRFPEAARAVSGHHLVRGLDGSGSDREVRVAVAVTASGRRFAIVLRESLSAVSGAVSVVRRAFVIAAAITLLVALMLGVLIATRLVRRLRALRTTAMRVADLGPGVEVHADRARDEIGDLTRAFATMQERLRAQEEARRTFVASASHELRTPLQSLLFMLDLLEDDLESGALDQAQAREDVRRARTQAERLSGLSAELLDLSRVDAGVALRHEPVELVALSRLVLAEFAARAVEANVRLQLVDAPSSWVLADPGAVAQIVRVLVDNALRFSPSGARIEVTAGTGTVAVTDQGPGVPAGERELIFQRFYRGQEGGGAGFGLGLAIGRELARRMGGDLHLDDGGPATRFVLTLTPTPPGAVEQHDAARKASEH